MYPRAESRLALDDLYRLPDDGRRHELSRGRLVSEPPPGVRHGRIAMRVAAALDSHVRHHQLGVVLTCDTGFVLARNPDTLRAPDIAFIKRQRFLALADETRAFPGYPDLAVEVLSPSDRDTGLSAKVADNMAAGTPLVWIVDPQSRRVFAHRTILEPAIFEVADVLTAPGVLPGFSVPVGDFFRF